MSRPPDEITEALADCLRRVDDGATPGEALARHPEVAAELEPLVTSAAAVKDLPPRGVRPAFRAELHHELVRLEGQRRSVTGAPMGARRRPLALRAFAMIAALVVVLGALVAASANARPGEALYPVRSAAGRLTAAAGVFGGWDRRGAAPFAETTPTGLPERPEREAHQLHPTPSAVARRGDGAVLLRRANTATPATSNTVAVPESVATERAAIVIVVEPAPTATTLVPTPTDHAGPTSPDPERRDGRTSATSTPPEGQPPATDVPPTSESGPSATTTAPDGTVSIGGTVKLADGGAGRPLAGVTVSIHYAPACPLAGSMADYLYHETRTDASGAYAAQVPPGVYVLSVGGRTDNDECVPVSWFASGGPVVESDDPCGVATNIDLTRGISAPLGYPLVYPSDVATTCP